MMKIIWGFELVSISGEVVIMKMCVTFIIIIYKFDYYYILILVVFIRLDWWDNLFIIKFLIVLL